MEIQTNVQIVVKRGDIVCTKSSIYVYQAYVGTVEYMEANKKYFILAMQYGTDKIFAFPSGEVEPVVDGMTLSELQKNNPDTRYTVFWR